MHSTANFSQFHGQQQQQRQPPPGYYQSAPAAAPNGGNYHLHRARNPGTIRWNANGVSISAERRLPFVHRFNPVGSCRPAILDQQQPQQQQQPEQMSSYDSNPVGALQERFQARGMMPEYKFLEMGSMPHCPLFKFDVRIGDVVTTGSGHTKKQAKQAAARSMLATLDGKATDGNDNVLLKGEETKAEESPVPNTTNHVGVLQEYCVSRGLPMPAYDWTSCIIGQTAPGMPFSVKVNVGGASVFAEASSKKEAKREAAFKMYKKLLQGVDSAPEDSKVKVEVMTQEHRQAIKSFYMGLDESEKGSTLSSLHMDLVGKYEGNYVKALSDLGKEQGFSITNVELDELTDEGEVQCLIQLTRLPVAVCYGSGTTAKEANERAAKSALHYLKTMTKKKSAGKVTTKAAAVAASDKDTAKKEIPPTRAAN